MFKELDLPRVLDRVSLVSAAAMVAAAGFSKALTETFAFLLYLAFLCRLLLPDARRPPRRFVLLLSVWLGACLLSAVVSSDPSLSLRAFWRKTLEYALIALAASAMARAPQASDTIVRVFAWAGLLIEADGLIQMFFGRDVLRLRSMAMGFSGPFDNPNTFASYLLMVIPAQYWALRQPSAWWRKGLWLLGVLVAMWEVVQTFSRAAWYALMVAMVVLWLVARQRALIWPLLALGGVIVWYWRGPTTAGPETLDNMFRLDAARREGWVVAWRMFLDHPLLGAGHGTFMANYMQYAPATSVPWPRPLYAHNCYLQLLAEGGLIGLASFAVLTGWVMAGAVRQLRRLRDADGSSLLGLFGALTVFLVNIGLDTGLYSLALAVLFWCFMGLTWGAAMTTRHP